METRLPYFITVPSINYYLNDKFLCLDFETTNLDNGDPNNKGNSLILATWCKGKKGKVKYKFGNEFNQQELIEDLNHDDVVFITSHYSKFELGWLQRIGIDTSKLLSFCTLLGEYTLFGNRRVPLDLDSCLQRRRLGNKSTLVKTMIKNGICPSDIPPNLLLEYCIKDTELERKLFLKQRKELEYKGLLKVIYTRNLYAVILADIEKHGLQLDEAKVNYEYSRTFESLKRVEQSLKGITGGINPNSTKQLRTFLFEAPPQGLGFDKPLDYGGNPLVTPGGELKVGKEVIARLKASNRVQREFIGLKREQGKLSARLTKALAQFKKCIDDKEAKGILNASIDQFTTQTGRTSSKGKKFGVQFQNIMRDIKYVFSARDKAYCIIEADAKQLEFRTAIDISGDRKGFKDIEEGIDIHANTASILGVTRQEAKAFTFKPLYGGTSGTKKQRDYFKFFKQRYSDLARYQEDCINEVLLTKQLTMPTGLVFYWPLCKTTKSGYIEYNTQIRDYPVQYFATGEIIPISIIFLWHYLKAFELKSFICNQVHDSVIGEVHKDEIELYKELCVQSFSRDCIEYIRTLYDYEIKVPIEVEFKQGTHWGENNFERG